MYTEVLFDEVAGKDGDLGIITLNRASVLNSLNHEMIVAIHAQLKSWHSASHIKAVVIKAAEGRAFCAGGDLRLTYERMKNSDPAMNIFFRDEYQLNRYIYHYPKPYIALLDGITMGGGVGISIHGSHRVATEKLLFAMPETGIGFFPDVGGSYFLPRLKNRVGYYLGLTGARLASDGCIALNIAQVKVSSAALPELLTSLAQTTFSSNARDSVSTILANFKLPAGPSIYQQNMADIEHCFNQVTIENIVLACQASPNKMCQEAAEMLLKKSPTSLKVTLQALQNGEQMDFDACMRQEFRLVNRFLVEHDFLEGIRAVIIDKDQQPQWEPSSIDLVNQQTIEKYFSP